MLPLPAKTVAGTTAICCFFMVGLIGLCYRLEPEICCRRALIATIVSYGMMLGGIKVINAVLTHALIDNWIKQEQEKNVGREDG